MSLVLLGIIIVSLIIAVFKFPGVYISYICFFQVLNNLVFDSLNLSPIKYVTVIVFLPIFILLNTNLVSVNNSVLFIKSRISIFFICINILILLYCLILGDLFHISYAISFVFPWLIIFFVIGLFVTNLQVLKELIYGFIIYTIVLFVFLYAVKDFWNIADYTRNIYPEIFGLSAIEISRFAAIPIIFSTLFLIINKNSKLLIKIFLLLIILFCLFQMLQSGTRGPVLGLLISFLIYLLYSDINKRSKSFIIAGFSLFIITFYLLVGQDSLLIDRALLLTEENAIESQNRYFRIVTFFELFPDHFLLGIGPGNWPDYVIDDQYPHNIFLEVIIELGLLGLILIAGLLLTCYRYLSDILTFISSDALSIGVVLLWFAMFFSFSLSGTVASTPFFSHCALLASTYLINKSYIQL